MRNKYLVAVCNLKPASMRGIKSYAMVLAVRTIPVKQDRPTLELPLTSMSFVFRPLPQTAKAGPAPSSSSHHRKVLRLATASISKVSKMSKRSSSCHRRRRSSRPSSQTSPPSSRGTRRGRTRRRVGRCMSSGRRRACARRRRLWERACRKGALSHR